MQHITEYESLLTHELVSLTQHIQMGTALGRLSVFESTRAVYRTRDQAQDADPAKQPTVGGGGHHMTSLFLCLLLLKVSEKALCAVRVEQSHSPLSFRRSLRVWCGLLLHLPEVAIWD